MFLSIFTFDKRSCDVILETLVDLFSSLILFDLKLPCRLFTNIAQALVKSNRRGKGSGGQQDTGLQRCGTRERLWVRVRVALPGWDLIWRDRTTLQETRSSLTLICLYPQTRQHIHLHFQNGKEKKKSETRESSSLGHNNLFFLTSGPANIHF